MNQSVINIRIEVDPDTDDKLDEWACKEKRSKREHVAYLVQELLVCYQSDPLVLHRLKIAASR